MATTYHPDIQKLYVAYFGRPADPAGLAYWEGIVEAANGSTTAVSAEFAASAEYRATYANMTTSQIVNAVYTNLFGRTAEAGGAAYWAGLLDNGTISIDNFVADVSRAAVGTDLTAFSNKASAALAFTNALDTDAERAGYTVESLQLAKDYIARVTTDSTLAFETNPANLNATVAAVVAAGTEFTLVGGLQGLQQAMAAKAAYLESITAEDAEATATDASVAADLQDAQGDFNTVFQAQDPDAYAIYSASGTSAAVRAALVEDQVASNAQGLVAAQAELARVTTEISQVSGLQTAINRLTAAETAQENAIAAKNIADLDRQVKAASFEVTAADKIPAGQEVDYREDGTVALVTDPATTDTPLIRLDANGSLELAVTEAQYPGITALLNSINAAMLADTTADNAALIVQSSQAAVTELDTNGLAADYAAAQQGVEDAEEAISDFTEAWASLGTAQQNADDLAGYNATITAAGELFAANDYNLVDLDDAVTPSQVATVDSDVYVVGEKGATINLFGLQGEDSIFVGTGYTLKSGALSTGDNSMMEIFVSQTGANTTLQIETSAFGSNATTPEVVSIVLVGVTATDVTLDSNGIITV
jgi:hypothetical protein